MNVFLVDDSSLLREQIGGMLSEMDDVEIVGEAGTVQDAERGILESRPDVVFLDIQMPGGSGLDVLRTVKIKLPEVKVIVLTNFAYPQYRKRCLDLGADRFLDKHKEFDKIPEALKLCGL